MNIAEILGSDAKYLLEHQCKTIAKESLYLPGPEYLDRTLVQSDRSPQVLRSLQALFSHGRLAGTRIHLDSPGRSGHRTLGGRIVRTESEYFDPENIVSLAIEGGCNAVASTLGVLGSSRANMPTRFRSS